MQGPLFFHKNCFFHDLLIVDMNKVELNKKKKKLKQLPICPKYIQIITRIFKTLSKIALHYTILDTVRSRSFLCEKILHCLNVLAPARIES